VWENQNQAHGLGCGQVADQGRLPIENDVTPMAR